ncbi:peptidase family M49-domain-containing protein [Tirmania nivea]|nr:peptidase family M49-domain-containing protein [Tirmania nivea]
MKGALHFMKVRGPAFELQVGLHEHLGHGTGKLLSELTLGNYNLDTNNPPIDPLTKEKITTWYKPGQLGVVCLVTWPQAMKSAEQSVSQCTLAGMQISFRSLGSGKKVISKGGMVLYFEYLSMARAGLLALEQWDLKSKACSSDDKIESHGKPSVGLYQQKPSIYKSIAEVEAGTKPYDEMTAVGEEMAAHRDIVLRKKQPRKQFVEANTFLKEMGGVVAV